MLVAFLPADIGFVDLDDARQLRTRLPPFADLLCHHPGGLLCDAEVPVKLHAGDAFQARGHEIHDDDPGSDRELARLHHGPGLDAEVAATGATVIGHRATVLRLGCLHVAAARAGPTIWPAHLLKPCPGNRFGRELGVELIERESSPVGFSRGFMCSCHVQYYTESWRYCPVTYIIPFTKGMRHRSW